MRPVVALLICTYFSMAACSSDPAPAVTPAINGPATIPGAIPPEWSYQSNAIDLNIDADPQLNLFHKAPHTLLLCTYHLRDPNSFNQLQDESGGLQKLLECDRFDPSVLYARKIVIQPGEKIRQSLDRSEGARYVGVAAGYYHMRKNKMTRSFSIPLAVEKRQGVPVQVPQKLTIDLHLGPQEILQLQKTQQSDKTTAAKEQ